MVGTALLSTSEARSSSEASSQLALQFKCASGLLHLQLFLLLAESVLLQPGCSGTNSPTCYHRPLTLDASSLPSLCLHPALLETLCLQRHP